MPRVGRKRKKRRTEKEVDPSEKEKKGTPKCFVLKRGQVGQRVKDLVQDMRNVMMPNTARSLKESKMNRIEDFMAVSGHYGVTHLIIFTTTKVGTYMKLAKLPQGPTLTFKVMTFSLARSVRAMQKRPRSGTRDYTSAPLQVLNGFGSGSTEGAAPKAGERQLVAEMLRGLFPSIDVRSFNQAECRRVALFNNDGEKDCIQFRHYSVSRRQKGLHKSISALLNPSCLPKLSRSEDLADFVLGSGGGADSDDEDLEAGSMGGGKTAVRLTEVGPRIELQLVKGEEGVLNGAVLFHRYLTRTPTEQEVLEQRARQRRKLKERNQRLDQEARAHNAKLKKKRKDKQEAAERASKIAAGATAEDLENDERDKEKDSGPAKKKGRFHPFAFKSKAGGDPSQKTVEIDDKPSKNKSRRGGRRQKAGGGDDSGRAKGKGGGKGGKQRGKGGKGTGSQKVLDRFHGAQKRKRS